MKRLITILGCLSIILCFSSCDDEEYSLVDTDRTPEFELIPLTDNPNMFVFRDNTGDVLSRTWDFGQNAVGDVANPPFSTVASDTVLFAKKGTYEVALHLVLEGIGPVTGTRELVIDEDAPILCDPTLSAFTNECTSQCWRLSPADGSILVGPVPFSGEWFTGNGLEPAQADDSWCFNGEKYTFEYVNAGATFSSCQGYIVDEDYPLAGELLYQVLPGAGVDGSMRIALPMGSWMGVEDSGPNYDIVEINEDQLIMVTTITPCDGAPSPGYFTLTFEKAE